MVKKCSYPAGHKGGKFVCCGEKGTEPFDGRYYCAEHAKVLSRLRRQKVRRRSSKRAK